MLKFYRKIRKKLIEKGNFKKYSFYAIGEILLVVIGILIALQINNWNQRRIDNSKETKYLYNLQKELVSNINLTQDIIKSRIERKIEGLKLGKRFSENQLVITDTLELLDKIGYGGVASGGLSFGARSFYDELLSTGNLQLIKKDTIKNSIANYYTLIGLYEERSKVHSSRYSNYLSELRPFDWDNPSFISEYDQNEMIQSFQTEEFRRLIDHELSYAYTIQRYAEESSKKANSIIELIRMELEGEL